MTYYEIKKVFAKRGNRIALLLLIALLLIVLHFMLVDTWWINEKGEEEHGWKTIRNIKAADKEWAGLLTEEKLRQVIAENNRINAASEYHADGEMEGFDLASWKKQGMRDILYLMDYSYGKFQDWDYRTADTLMPDDARYFYQNRITNLKEWLTDDDYEGGANEFSDKEKAYLIEQYEKLHTPIYYDYQEGWRNLFQWFQAITMFTTMVLGFICAAIFSDEFRLKANAILYSSYHGRRRAILAKLKAGFLVITAVYWGMILLYTVLVLGIYGADGANCQIQSTMSGWKSFNNLTNGQVYILAVWGGYLGCLFMIAVTMMISAAFKSSLLAVLMPSILIFLPAFIGQINTPLLSKILGLLPDQLLQLTWVVEGFNLYEIGGKITGAVPVLFAIYLALTVILFPVIYHTYRKKQIL